MTAKLYASTVAACLAGFMIWPVADQADAATHILHRHKNWQVQYIDENDGYPFCQAGVYNAADGLSFGISVNAQNDFMIWIHDEQVDYDRAGVNIGFQVDRRKGIGYKLVDADYQTITLWPEWDKPTQKLMRDIAAGRTLFVYELDRNMRWPDRRNWFYQFSLAGSRASMNALIECWERLT